MQNCREWGAGATNFGYMSRYRWPLECFDGESIELPFEYLSVTVPASFEKMLQITYGDWKKYVKGDSMHSGLIPDAETSWQDKIMEIMKSHGDDNRRSLSL